MGQLICSNCVTHKKVQIPGYILAPPPSPPKKKKKWWECTKLYTRSPKEEQKTNAKKEGGGRCENKANTKSSITRIYTQTTIEDKEYMITRFKIKKSKSATFFLTFSPPEGEGGRGIRICQFYSFNDILSIGKYWLIPPTHPLKKTLSLSLCKQSQGVLLILST